MSPAEWRTGGGGEEGGEGVRGGETMVRKQMRKKSENEIEMKNKKEII